MFLIAQLWMHFLAAALLGAAAVILVQRSCRPQGLWRRPMASVRGGEAPVGARAAACRSDALMTAGTARVAADARTDEPLQALRAALEERQQQLDTQARQLSEAGQEIEVLRRQVLAGRSELAEVLGRHEIELAALRGVRPATGESLVADPSAVEAWAAAAVTRAQKAG